MELYLYEQRIVKLLELKRYAQAQDELQKALSLFPEAASLFCLEGYTFHLLGDDRAALKAYTKAIASDPGLPHAHKEAALLYHRDNNNEAAKHHIDIALGQLPDNADILAVASVIYSGINPWRSQQLMNSARSFDPLAESVQAADAYQSLMSLKLGRFKRILVANMAKNPDSSKAMLGMGILELSNGRFDQAQPLLRQAYVAEPDAGTLDAWIDSRLGKYFPFSLTIPLGWIWYPFGLGFQVVFFLVFLFMALGIVMIEFPEAYNRWIWIPHVLIAAFFSITYLLKYPLQYYFKRAYHSETRLFTMRDFFKAGLFISTIIYWIVIFTKDLNLLLCAVFILIYLPSFYLVMERRSWFTRALYLLIYILAWCSFLLSIVLHYRGIEFPRWVELPMLLGWIALLMLVDPINKLEDRLAEGKR